MDGQRRSTGAVSMLGVVLTTVLLVSLLMLPPPFIHNFEQYRSDVWQDVERLSGPIGMSLPPEGEPRELLTNKTDSGEHVLSTSVSPTGVEDVLYKHGWHWNPLSTKKYRTVGGERQYSVGSWVYRSGLLAERQLHCYLFPREDGGADVYCHYEYNYITHPGKHSRGVEQIDGDPNGRLPVTELPSV